MSDCIANKIHEWSHALGQLASHYAGLGPAERRALATRLAGYPQYECVDPLAEVVRHMQKELLLAIADEFSSDTAVAASAVGPSGAPAYAVGRKVSGSGQWPGWSEGSEFRRVREESLGPAR